MTSAISSVVSQQHIEADDSPIQEQQGASVEIEPKQLFLYMDADSLAPLPRLLGEPRENTLYYHFWFRLSLGNI